MPLRVSRLDRAHVVDRQRALGCPRRREQLADPLRAVAVVPVGGEADRAVRAGHRLVRRDDEPLGRVAAPRAARRRARAAPVVPAVPARLRPGAVRRDRLVAGVAVRPARRRGPGSGPAPGSRCGRRRRRRRGSARARRAARPRPGTSSKSVAGFSPKIASIVAARRAAPSRPARPRTPSPRSQLLAGDRRGAAGVRDAARSRRTASGPCTVSRTRDRHRVAAGHLDRLRARRPRASCAVGPTCRR